MEDSENPTHTLNRDFARYTSMTLDQLTAELEKVEAEKKLVDEKWRAAGRGTPERNALRTERLEYIHRKDKIKNTMADRNNGIEPGPAYSSSTGSEPDVPSKDSGNDPSTEAEPRESDTADAQAVEVPEKDWLDLAAAFLENMMPVEPKPADPTSSIPSEAQSVGTNEVINGDGIQFEPKPVESEDVPVGPKMEINTEAVKEPIEESPKMQPPPLREAPAVHTELKGSSVDNRQGSIQDNNRDPSIVASQTAKDSLPAEKSAWSRIGMPVGIASAAVLLLAAPFAFLGIRKLIMGKKDPGAGNGATERRHAREWSATQE